VPSFATAGFTVIRNALTRVRCNDLAALTELLDVSGPGTRCLLSLGWAQQLAAEIQASAAFRDVLPRSHVAVQCTYFEKSAKNNWLVPIHQDLSVPVAHQDTLPGWGPWSTKEGVTFVQPPVAVLEQLVAVRVHLDPCGSEDGPLHVVPGSHLQGVISPGCAIELRRNERACLAQVGDALAFRPLLLHRSTKSSGASRRRVLHILFAPMSSALGVQWRSAA